MTPDEGLVDVDALGSLPPFDDALIPEAMNILGFDMPPGGSLSEAYGIASADLNVMEVFEDDEEGSKKPKVPGGNQREVQKRYRERKKNYTKDLEKKVATLETELKKLQSENEEKHEDAFLTHVALGRIVPHRDECGYPEGTYTGGFLNTRTMKPSQAGSPECKIFEDDSDTHSAVAKGDGALGDNARLASCQVGECPLEHRKFCEEAHEKTRKMRALLEAGASDAQLSDALLDMISYCAPRRAMGADFSYQNILNKHANALNDERSRFEARPGNGEKRNAVGESNETPAASADDNSTESLTTTVARERVGVDREGETTTNRLESPDDDSGRSGVCGTVCGGRLRVVALDGTVMSEEDVSASVSAAADYFLLHTPPIELEKIISWRDEYMDELKEVYFTRQKLGLQLAAAGGAIVAQTRTNAPVEDFDREVVAGGGVPEKFSKTSVANLRDGAQTQTTVTLSRGGEGFPSHASIRVGETLRNGSFAVGGAKMMDVLTIVELLKRSVKREMNLKFDRIRRLVIEVLSPRTAAHLASATYPAIPDPLAIATELKARKFAGARVKT